MPVRVLLVEPHDHVNHAFKRAIANSKYEIGWEASSGDDAIQQVKSGKSRPDMVVMDMVFPGLGGIRTMEEIHKINAKVPVVLIHDQKSAFRVVEARSKGAASHVRYPFKSPEEVLKELAIAEGGGGSVTLGSEDHFVHLEKPLAVTFKKPGLFSFLGGSGSGITERVSVNEVQLVTAKKFPEQTIVDLTIHFPGADEKVQGRISGVKAKGDSYELTVKIALEREQRDHIRKLLLKLATRS
jgi:CheY-like chemotaxis protein